MRKPLVLLSISIMLLSSLAQADIVNEDDAGAEWTFMIYLDADNNLEGAGIEDFNEMEIAGSTDNVNIIAQFDRAQDYDTSNEDWTTAKRYHVVEDAKNSVIVSDELEDLGEVNMGDPNTLVDFVEWGIDNYPAQRYALVLWDHGGAFWGVDWDDDTNNSDDHDWLSMVDLKEALLQIEDHLGRNIDLLGFDACLMANMGVLHQIRHNVDVAVGSGYVEPGEGWPYERILPKLIANPHMEAADLGRVISDEYVDSYSDRNGDPDDSTAITMATFDMVKLGILSHEIDKLGMVLALNSDIRPLRGHWLQIQQARSDTNSYDFPSQYTPGNQIPIDPGGYSNYDVIDLMDNIQKYLPFDTEIVNQAEAVKKAARDATIHYRATGYTETVKGANGLTIYFPSGTDNDYSPVYDTLDLANESYWDEFLHFYHNKQSATDTPPSLIIDQPEDGAELPIERGIFAVTGEAYDFQGVVGTVEYRVDEGEWTDAGGSNDWSFILDTHKLQEGVHRIDVRVDDSSIQCIYVKVVQPQGTKDVIIDEAGNGGIMAAGVAFIALVVIGALLLGRRKETK